MSTLLTVGATTPVPILGLEQPSRITNTNTSGTLYLGGSAVSSSSNTYTVAAGANIFVTTPIYGIGSVAVNVLVEEMPLVLTAKAVDPWTRIFPATGALDMTSGNASTTPVANTAYVCELDVRRRCLLTGIRYSIGATGGTDKAVAMLYDASGKVLAWSAIAGTTVGTLNTAQSLAFLTPIEVYPGRYFAGVAINGTTARIRLTTSTDTGVLAGTQASATDFVAAPVNITVPTTPAAVPVLHTY